MTAKHTKGDVITLSASPTIPLAKYQFLKPHASVQVVIGDDAEQSLEDGRERLQAAVYHAALTELTFVDELTAQLSDDSSIEGLVQFLLEKVNGETSLKESDDTEEEEVAPRTRRRKSKSGKSKKRRVKAED